MPEAGQQPIADQKQRRQQEKGHQRQAPIHNEHHHSRYQNGQHIEQQIRQAVDEKLHDFVGVGIYPLHQAAGLPSGEEADREFLQGGKHTVLNFTDHARNHVRGHSPVNDAGNLLKQLGHRHDEN